MKAKHILAAAAAALATMSAQAVVVTLDGPQTVTPGPEFGALDATYSHADSGFLFVSTGRLSDAFAHWSFNGAANSCLTPGNCSFTVTREDGGLFSLDGFLGRTANFDFCVLNGGIGPSDIFVAGEQMTCTLEHYAFASAFVDSLTLSAVGLDSITLDNFEFSLSPVPEPSTLTLLLAGLGLMGALQRKRA